MWLITIALTSIVTAVAVAALKINAPAGGQDWALRAAATSPLDGDPLAYAVTHALISVAAQERGAA